MQVFTLKMRHELKWDDIPFVENPVFAVEHALGAIRYGDKMWNRVTNVREFIATEIGHYDCFFNDDWTERKVNDVFQRGLYFSVACHGKPFCPAFTWKEDPHYPSQGEWLIQHQDYSIYKNSVERYLADMGNQRRRMVAEEYLEELQSMPYAIAQAAVTDTLAIPMAKASATIAAAPIINTQATKAIASVENDTAASVADEPTPAYRVLTGKYGTLHDYGDHIVHWDIDNVIGRSDILSKPAYTTRHCYALGEGFGLPITDEIAPGKPLLDFGGDIPHGTIFATFVPDGKGNMVYPNSRNKVDNSPHLFVYDANEDGLVKIGDNQYEVSVIEQWAGLSKVSQNTIHQNTNDSYRLYKNLDKYYAVTVKK